MTASDVDGSTRTAVERRIKDVAVELSRTAQVDGLNEEGAAFVRRLRLHREAILAALPSFERAARSSARAHRIPSQEEIQQAGRRIKARSSRYRTRHITALTCMKASN